MSTCAELAANASSGVAPALRAVDCLANETTAAAFGRLFGGNGALVPALTGLLTLYIAFFAISLLTGRSRLGISALTPRMMTLGLVLTFATSWIAYQSVVWNLAIGAPDQIASVLTGARGSATQIFADRIDIVFAAIAEVATSSGQSAQGASSGATSGSFTPANVMWLGALLLLLGTVGILVTARIALAVLLAVGPVFVVFALFSGTRGLTAGWLRAVVLTATTPLFVVTGGGIVMELLVPVIGALRSGEGQIDGRAAMALFLIAAVHIALMTMIMRVTASMVSGWQVFGLASPEISRSGSAAQAAGAVTVLPQDQAAAITNTGGRRSAVAFAQTMTPAAEPATDASSVSAVRTSRTEIVTAAAQAAPALPALRARRASGIGSRFQTQPRNPREMLR